MKILMSDHDDSFFEELLFEYSTDETHTPSSNAGTGASAGTRTGKPPSAPAKKVLSSLKKPTIERVQLRFDIPIDLAIQLQDAAFESDHSVNTEIACRLKKSFCKRQDTNKNPDAKSNPLEDIPAQIAEVKTMLRKEEQRAKRLKDKDKISNTHLRITIYTCLIKSLEQKLKHIDEIDRQTKHLVATLVGHKI
ncbi:MAG: hypothetical protein MESAZ_02257 [Saezia sanguinis]